MSESNHSDWPPIFSAASRNRVEESTYSSAMLASEQDGLPYINMKSFLKGGGFNANGLKRYAGFYTLSDLVGERDLLLANTDVTAGDIVGVPHFYLQVSKMEKYCIRITSPGSASTQR